MASMTTQDGYDWPNGVGDERWPQPINASPAVAAPARTLDAFKLCGACLGTGRGNIADICGKCKGAGHG